MATPSISHLPAQAAASAPSSTPAPPTSPEGARRGSVHHASRSRLSIPPICSAPKSEITFIKDPNSNRLLTRVVTARLPHELVAQISLRPSPANGRRVHQRVAQTHPHGEHFVRRRYLEAEILDASPIKLVETSIAPRSNPSSPPACISRMAISATVREASLEPPRSSMS